MKKTALAALAALTLSSCSPTQALYSWHGYEDATYQYYKKRTDELNTRMLGEYLKMAQSQKGKRGVVPPGLSAEHGFALYMSGKREEGMKLLKEEIRLYPESQTYISRIIKQLEK